MEFNACSRDPGHCPRSNVKLTFLYSFLSKPLQRHSSGIFQKLLTASTNLPESMYVLRFSNTTPHAASEPPVCMYFFNAFWYSLFRFPWQQKQQIHSISLSASLLTLNMAKVKKKSAFVDMKDWESIMLEL